MKSTLTFDLHGQVHCLYTESINLQQLGTLEMKRATSIEFNVQSQQWEVRDVAGAILHTNPSRSRCLAWELDHFNR